MKISVTISASIFWKRTKGTLEKYVLKESEIICLEQGTLYMCIIQRKSYNEQIAGDPM
jgi:hypothetical protein